MKRLRLYTILVVLTAGAVDATADTLTLVSPAPATEAKPIPGPFDPFSLKPEYRRVVLLDPTALSPFRKPEARAAQAAGAAPKNTGPNVPAVLAKFHQLGLTGVIPSTPRRPGLIILGGNIYREGDELSVTDAHSRGTLPFLAEHKVILRSVTGQALALWVSHIADPNTAPLNVPVGLLEFRQR